MFNRSLTSIFLIFTIFVFKISATPDKAFKERKILIGANKTHYFCLLEKRAQPGSMFIYYDSIFINKYNLQTSLLKKSILLKTIKHQDTTSFGDWQITEKNENTNFLLGRFLIDEDINLVFPTDDFNKRRLKITEHGLQILSKNKKLYTVLPAQELVKRTNTKYLNHLHIMAFYENKQNYFVYIDYGDFCCIDSDSIRYIIVLDKKSVKDLMYLR